MKTKRDFFNAKVGGSHLTFNHIGNYPPQETTIGSKLIIGKVSDPRKFHVPHYPSHSSIILFNLIDWNLVWNEKKVYNFYYSIPFRSRRRNYK